MDSHHYFDGRWVGADQLHLSAFDLTVLRGFGIFDFMRTYNRIPFRLEDHLDRLTHSAELLNISLPVTREEIKTLIEKGLALNDLPETCVRIVVTGGISDDFITPGPPSFILIFKPVKTPPPEVYQNGVSVITWAHRRNLPEAKTLNYFEAVMGMRAAQQQGAAEAIYTDPSTQELFEGTGTNIFTVKDGVISTPPEGVLKGITRKVVLELAASLNLPCRQEKVYLQDLGACDEVFITNSSKQIVPVIKVNDLIIGDGKVGKVSQQLKKAFEEYASSC